MVESPAKGLPAGRKIISAEMVTPASVGPRYFATWGKPQNARPLPGKKGWVEICIGNKGQGNEIILPWWLKWGIEVHWCGESSLLWIMLCACRTQETPVQSCQPSFFCNGKRCWNKGISCKKGKVDSYGVDSTQVTVNMIDIRENMFRTGF